MPVPRFNIKSFKDADSAVNAISDDLQNKGFIRGVVAVFANLPSAALLGDGIIYLVQDDSPGYDNGFYVTSNHTWTFFDALNFQNTDEVPNESTVTGTTTTDALDNLLPLSGGVMTGAIDMTDNPVEKAAYLELQEITTPAALANYGKVYTKTDDKLYFQNGAGVEAEVAVGSLAYLPLAGGTMTGDIAMLGNKIEFGTNPSVPHWIEGGGTDLKFYLDNMGTPHLAVYMTNAGLYIPTTKRLIMENGLQISTDHIDMFDDPIKRAEYLELEEITTPTPVANYGKIYTKSDDKLYFQNGAGVEAEVAVGSLAYLPLAGGTMTGALVMAAQELQFSVANTKFKKHSMGNGLTLTVEGYEMFNAYDNGGAGAFWLASDTFLGAGRNFRLGSGSNLEIESATTYICKHPMTDGLAVRAGGTAIWDAHSTGFYMAAPEMVFSDASNIGFGTSVGTMIGQTAAQKMGFWGVTPVVQQTGAMHGAWATLPNLVAGLIAAGIIAA